LTLLDANALIGFLLAEPAHEEMAALLRRGDCAIPAACLGEVVDSLMRKHGVDRPALSERLGALLSEVLSVLPADERIAWRAGELRAAHYRRADCALSLADCLLLASAGPDDEIATADGAVIATAEKLSIATIPLPRGDGPQP
jgi:predicted nucleic acid-binding protein